MNPVNLVSADLNLLRVFLAIWDLRSLTAAGERLGLSQPAVSHALRRLRTVFDDPLFVRTPQAMVPTEAAKRLQGPLDEAFGIINLAMQQHAHFDPSTADRVFRMSMSDMSEFYCLPPLLAALENTAPGVRFEIVQLSAESVGAAMRAGEIDLTFGYVPGLEEGCVSERLFLDEYVCLVRAGHPLKARKASKDDLMGLRYLYASTNATGHYMIDQWMRDLGIPRQIVVRVPHFIVAPEVLRNTDLAAIFPRSIAEQFNRGRAFRLLTLPFELPPIEVSLHTHVRFASDPGIRWLRETLLTIFSRG